MPDTRRRPIGKNTTTAKVRTTPSRGPRGSRGPGGSSSSVNRPSNKPSGPAAPTANGQTYPLNPGTQIEPENPEIAESPTVPETNFGSEDIKPDFMEGRSSSEEPVSDVAKSERDASIDAGIGTAQSKSEKSMSSEAAIENAAGDKKIRVKLQQRMNSRRSKIYAGAAAVSVTVGIVGSVAFLPSFIMKQMMSKLTQTFMDSSTYALKQRAEAYVRAYVIGVVGPGYNNCGGTVNRLCQDFDPGQSIASRLFTTWRNGNLEGDLFEKHGLEFEVDRNDPNNIKIFKTNPFGVKGEVGTFGRNSATREVTKIIQTETRFQGVVDRRHIRSVLSTKYNAKKYCFIACNTKDDVADIKLSALRKLKLKLIARVAEPFNAKMSTYMLCFVVSCGGDLDRQANAAAREIIERTDKELITKIAKEIEEAGTRDITQFALQKLTRSIIEKVITRGAGQVAGQAAGRAAASAIPIAGQIYLALTIVDLLDRVDESIENRELSKFLRRANEEAYANYAATFLSTEDDTQSFEASIEDSGAMFNMVKGFSASRLSQAISGTSPKSTIECKDDVVLTGEDDPLVCPDKAVQPTLSIEEARNNPIVNTVLDFANIYDACPGVVAFDRCVPPAVRPKTVIRPLLGLVDWALGSVTNAIFNGVRAIPGVGSLIDGATNFISDNLNPLISGLSEKLFPSALNAVAEGAELFDQVAGGLDVTNNAFVKGYTDEDGTEQGLGGKRLTPQESAELRLAIAEDKKEEFKSKSFFARYFDLNSTDSLASITTLAAAEGVFNGDIVEPSIPVDSIASTIASVFGFGQKANALSAVDRESLFGVAQYGFPVDDLAMTVEPTTLTPEVCAQYAQARAASRYTDEQTGEEQYTVTNPCMIDAVVVDALTKTKNLDQGQTTDGVRGGTFDINQGFIQGQPVRPETLDLRAECPISPNISDLGLENGAYFNGNRLTIRLCNVHGLRINTAYASAFDRMFTDMKAAGYTINGSYAFRDAAGQQAGFGSAGSDTFATPGFSYHQFGVAADMSCQGGGASYSAGTGRGRESFLQGVSQYPCLSWLAANSNNYGLLLQCVGESQRQGGGEIRRDSGGCEWWHISPTGG